MTFLEAVVRSAFPLLLVMSGVALLVPAARPHRMWSGLGWTWLGVVLAGLLLTLTHLGGMGCTFDLVWRGAGVGSSIGPGPCVGADPLPLWQVALPPGLGIGLLLAWLARHTAPASLAVRRAAVLLIASTAVVVAGQADANLGLLALVVLVVGSYAWLWIRDRFGEMRPASSG